MNELQVGDVVYCNNPLHFGFGRILDIWRDLPDGEYLNDFAVVQVITMHNCYKIPHKVGSICKIPLSELSKSNAYDE